MVSFRLPSSPPPAATRRCRVVVAVSATLALVGAPLAPASGVDLAAAPVQFRIVIPPVLRLHRSGPTALTLTHDDLVRGYVDVPMADQLSIVSNVPGGFRLQLSAAESGFVRGIEAQGLPIATSTPPSAAIAFAAQDSPGRPVTYQIHWRFYLASTATAGVHPWPIAGTLHRL